MGVIDWLFYERWYFKNLKQEAEAYSIFILTWTSLPIS